MENAPPSTGIARPSWVGPVLDIAAGTLGGAAGKLIEFPFDTLKVRLQAAGIGAHERYDGLIDCAQKLYREHGVRSFYRGMSLPLLGTIAETSCLFMTNGVLKRWLSKAGHIAADAELPMPYVLLSGAGTGFVVSWVLTPIELIKCRLQVAAADVESHGRSVTGLRSEPVTFRGPLDCLVQSVRHEGLSVLYRGHIGTLLREVPGTACWFGAYEMFVRWMTPPGAARRDVSPATIVAAGALGGMSYWTVMYPCDTVKSAMQITQSAPADSTGIAATPHDSVPGPRVVGSSGSSSSSGSDRITGATPQDGSSKLSRSRPALTHATASQAVYVKSLVPAQGAMPSAALIGSSPAAAFSTAAPISPAPATVATPAISRSFHQSFLSIYRTLGIRGLYAGLTPTLLRAAPSNAAIFLVYEASKKRLDSYASSKWTDATQ